MKCMCVNIQMHTGGAFTNQKCWPGSQPLNLMMLNLLDQNRSHECMLHVDSNEVASFLAALL